MHSDTWPDLTTLKPGAHRVSLHYGSLPDGTALNMGVTLMVGSQARPCVAVTAAVHGDEYEGVRAVAELCRELEPAQLTGTVMLIPVVNAPAFNAATRISPLDGLNLNRIFPGRPDGTPSERLAHVLTQHIIRQADGLIDLHSGGTRYLFQPQAGFYHLPEDEALSERSYAMAQAFGLDVLWELPGRAGVNSYEAMRAGVPAIGLEIGGNGRCEQEHIRLAKRGVRRVLSHLGVLNDTHDTVHTQQGIWRGDFELCPVSGLFDPAVSLNQFVQSRQLLYSILDLEGHVIYQRFAAHAGLVSAIRIFAAIQAGEWDVSILRRVA